MASVKGKWVFKSSENMEAFLTAIGVPEEFRQNTGDMKPDMTISQSGDTWTKSTKMGDKSTDVNFKLGEPCDHQNYMGQAVKYTFSLDGDKLIEKQTGGTADVTVTREVVGDELVSTLVGNGETGIVKFQRA